jgi:hypothetical protein
MDDRMTIDILDTSHDAFLELLLGRYPDVAQESRLRKSEQEDRWSFCLTAGTLCPTNQETR